MEIQSQYKPRASVSVFLLLQNKDSSLILPCKYEYMHITIWRGNKYVSFLLLQYNSPFLN